VLPSELFFSHRNIKANQRKWKRTNVAVEFVVEIARQDGKDETGMHRPAGPQECITTGSLGCSTFRSNAMDSASPVHKQQRNDEKSKKQEMRSLPTARLSDCASRAHAPKKLNQKQRRLSPVRTETCFTSREQTC